MTVLLMVTIGTVYVALQGHDTQSDWTPPAVPALFQPLG